MHESFQAGAHVRTSGRCRFMCRAATRYTQFGPPIEGIRTSDMNAVMHAGGSCCYGRLAPQHSQAHPILRCSRTAAVPVASLRCGHVTQQSAGLLRPALRQVVRYSKLEKTARSSDSDLGAQSRVLLVCRVQPTYVKQQISQHRLEALLLIALHAAEQGGARPQLAALHSNRIFCSSSGAAQESRGFRQVC